MVRHMTVLFSKMEWNLYRKNHANMIWFGEANDQLYLQKVCNSKQINDYLLVTTKSESVHKSLQLIYKPMNMTEVSLKTFVRFWWLSNKQISVLNVSIKKIWF